MSRKRDRKIHSRVNARELEYAQNDMKKVDCKSMSEFIRKSIYEYPRIFQLLENMENDYNKDTKALKEINENQAKIIRLNRAEKKDKVDSLRKNIAKLKINIRDLKHDAEINQSQITAGMELGRDVRDISNELGVPDDTASILKRIRELNETISKFEAEKKEIAILIGIDPESDIKFEYFKNRIDYHLGSLDECQSALREIAKDVGAGFSDHENRNVDPKAVSKSTLEFRDKYWKLKTERDHLHELAYEPIWEIIARRFYLFFIYPISRHFRGR